MTALNPPDPPALGSCRAPIKMTPWTCITGHLASLLVPTHQIHCHPSRSHEVKASTGSREGDAIPTGCFDGTKEMLLPEMCQAW